MEKVLTRSFNLVLTYDCEKKSARQSPKNGGSIERPAHGIQFQGERRLTLLAHSMGGVVSC